ncbi:MAG: YraN family protein [Elusimicrobia bacterium CG06_land_8_20_14_3_00_38_11]|nr:MAG: YraN family protein [Elusimicrobia bacterium CG06_land_8_20_14_3_00_38_11]
MTESGELGKSGEELAERYLTKLGYKILAQNFRTKYGEIDIIAKDKKTIVFVEVKTRSGDAYGTPQLAVNFYKQKHLSFAAFSFIKKNSLNSDYRFDIIAICDDKIEHIKNAFAPSGFTI